MEGMGRGLLLLLASMVAVPTGVLAQGQPAPAQPTFRSGVDLVTVAATVRDRKGRLVKGLDVGDFEVVDQGQMRRIVDFRAESSPVSIAILFDVSGSMRVADRMLAGKFAAHHVLSWLEPGRDEAALFTFDSRLHEVAPFTVDTRTLQGALGEVDPFGATSLHDAIAEAAKRVATREGRRRAVVVITDGIDNGSGYTPAQVSGIASAIARCRERR
jgi:Ca-activated chloride channel homolog